MKQITILSILLFLALQLHGQSNLQLSQVKYLTSAETVPAGKVWKIEGVFYSGSLPGWPSPTYSANYNSSILINSVTIVIRSARFNDGGSGGHAAVVWEQKFPMWLTAGNSLAPSTDVQGISVLEFTLIP